MTVVAITGASGRIGRRVVARAAADPDVERVLAVDVAPPAVADEGRVTGIRIDLADDELGAVFDGVDTVVHLAFSSRTESDGERARHVNVDGTRRLLDVLDRASQVVGLSSATVYGAWPNNPVPLTEDAPLRPNPEFAYAVQKAQIELAVDEWGDASGDRSAAVLRPCVALAEDGATWVSRVLAAGAGLLRTADVDPPAQFVHLDDLADAIDVVRRRRLSGPFNVAPDGWVPGDEVRALAGATPRPRLPVSVAAKLAEWSWQFNRGPIPPGLVPYTRFPWVVANDRLKRAGWLPANTNQEAYVAGTDGRWWTMLSPRRRQELALGVAGGALLAVAAGAGTAVRATVGHRSRR